MKQLHPNAVWLFFCNFLIQSFIPLLFVIWGGSITSRFDESELSTVMFFSFLRWTWLLIPPYVVLCFIWAKLTYKYYRYELLDSGFRKESGVIYKKYVTIPYSKIQNVDINRGILSRLLGLSDLNIQTAGTSATISRYGASGIGAEGRLVAVSKEDAELLRDELILRSSQTKSVSI